MRRRISFTPRKLSPTTFASQPWALLCIKRDLLCVKRELAFVKIDLVYDYSRRSQPSAQARVGSPGARLPRMRGLGTRRTGSSWEVRKNDRRAYYICREPAENTLHLQRTHSFCIEHIPSIEDTFLL
jgi:hypothetical protein